MDSNEKRTFFFQTPLGLEALGLKEFELKFPVRYPNYPLPHGEAAEGGYTLELPLAVGLGLNYWLKIPNRILLREAHFKCRDIPKLYNKIKKLNLRAYYAGQDFNLEVSSHNSRLFDDRKIKKAVSDALADNLKAHEPKADAKIRVSNFEHWNLFIRFEEDWCTISIDTSGLRLGMRGYKNRVGKAPLRENLASSLYFFTALSLPESIGDSFTRALTLIDPFCGSGTILMESVLFFEPNLFRNYAFEFFPCVKDLTLKRPTSYFLERELFLLGSDIDEERIKDTRENFKEAGLLTVPHHLQVGDLSKKDFQKKLSIEIFSPNQKRKVLPWFLSNPPYGKRIPQDLKASELLKSLNLWGTFERIGLLLPRDQLAGLTPPQGMSPISHLDFIHGGEKVRFSLFSNVDVS